GEGLEGRKVMGANERKGLTPQGSRGGSVRVLRSLLDSLEVDRYRYVVEFRHRSWLDASRRALDPEALALLREKRAALCILDSPGFPATLQLTARHTYLRFHGRNYDLWYRREKPEGDERINRYDYLYSDEELRPWAELVRGWMGAGEGEREGRGLGSRNGGGSGGSGGDGGVWADRLDEYESGLREVRIAFNNHGHARAVLNGLRFREMLGLGAREPLSRPRTLEDFG
ncbi:MAG: DUF72 domain-containing protein, partial [Thermoplasmatota archaeon]